jgi:hypothetical protein
VFFLARGVFLKKSMSSANSTNFVDGRRNPPLMYLGIQHYVDGRRNPPLMYWGICVFIFILVLEATKNNLEPKKER